MTAFDGSHPASDRIAERITAAAQVAMSFVSLLDRGSIHVSSLQGQGARLALADERLALSTLLLASMTGSTADHGPQARGGQR